MKKKIIMEEISMSDLEPPQYKLGSGEFGRVFEATFRGKPVVYKIMKHAIHNSVHENELKILYSLRDVPHVPRVYGFARCPERDILYLIMEKAPGITLYNYVFYNDISFLWRLYMAKNICRTIAHLHERFVLYRDLKPDNIVIDPSDHHHFLIDFGLSVQCASIDERVEGMAGTPGYMAPEIYMEKQYGFPIDIYSLGMTLYFLFTHREPERLSVLYFHLTHSNVPRDIQMIILDCLQLNTRHRPTAMDLHDRLTEIYTHWRRLKQVQKKKKPQQQGWWSFWWCRP